jgi:hypothetical protein
MDDIAQTSSKRDVGGFDGVEQQWSIDLCNRHVREYRIALELRYFERRLDPCDDRFQEICEDILSVLEFRSLQVGRVSGDVGEQQTSLLGCRERVGHPREPYPALLVWNASIPNTLPFLSFGAHWRPTYSAAKASLCSEKDVNKDGVKDLVCKMETAQLSLRPGTPVANLVARTVGGDILMGQDSIALK